jgi:hypothetical protein
MESFSVETTLSLADWQVYLRAYQRRLQAGATSRTQVVYAITAAAVVAPMIGLLNILHAPQGFFGSALEKKLAAFNSRN